MSASRLIWTANWFAAPSAISVAVVAVAFAVVFCQKRHIVLLSNGIHTQAAIHLLDRQSCDEKKHEKIGASHALHLKKFVACMRIIQIVLPGTAVCRSNITIVN